MKLLVILSFINLLPIFASTDPYDDLWSAYQIKHKKQYDEEYLGDRKKIWEHNVRMVAKHNLEADMGLHTYRLELNKFSDMTHSELDVYRKCFSRGNSLQKVAAPDYLKCDRWCYASLPKSVDWRKKNRVTPVKDQGDCGSCWAFSATGALEGQNKAKTDVLVSLSEQNLIDCSTKQGNNGCDGGWMDYAFQYVIDNQGIDVEEKYPYIAVENFCTFVRSAVGANCTKFVRLQEGSEKQLKVAVAKIGPVSVAIDASGDKFMSYKEGIYHDKTCSSVELDHAVLVVGYGTLNGHDYWIVKNSWGKSWGMNGYILMARNMGNMCGIATHAVYPVI